MTRGQWIFLCSVLCYTAGVVAVLLLPLLAKNTYISENALMPGSGNPMFGKLDTSDARASAAKLTTMASQEQDAQREVSKWLVEQMSDLGADCYLHPFYRPQSASLAGYVTPSQHFKWINSSLSQADHVERRKGLAVNVVGIVRAPQGEGNEAIVLVTPFDSHNFGQDDGLSLGIGLALFARLSKALWVARDIIWVVADARYGAYPAVAEWLREYHEPRLNDFSMKAKLTSDLVKEFLLEGQSSSEQTLSLSDFKRAGTIATGLVFELTKIPEGTLEMDRVDSVKLRAEGPNGQMPNLDLINIINSIAVWREGLTLQLESLPSLKSCSWLKYIGDILVKLSTLARQANPTWDFGAGAAAYADNFATLLSSMFFQVIGLPTGAHGAFRDYQIDAVTLQFPVEAQVFDYRLTKFGRLLEGVLRSVNNLLEKWHQSFFLYFLSATHKYISVGVYMQPFALLLISLPLNAIALCFPTKEEEMSKNLKDGSAAIKGSTSETPNGGRDNGKAEGSSAIQDSIWLQALLVVSSTQIWAFFAALLLFLISKTNFSAEMKLSVWLVIVAASLKVSLDAPAFFSGSMSTDSSPLRPRDMQLWVAVKALTLGVTSIGLSVMSTVNYPVALVGALILVPLCLGVLPLQYSWHYANRPGQVILTILALTVGACMIIIGSPPGLARLVWSLGGNVWTASPANFWYFMESLVRWQSALFPYLIVIHLPCSVLCIYILFSSHQPKEIKT
ncbi:unnamed protein product [Calypogeia fissa]